MGEERSERLGAGEKDGEERQGFPVGVAGDEAPDSPSVKWEEPCLPVGVAGDSALLLRKENGDAGLDVGVAWEGGGLQLGIDWGDMAAGREVAFLQLGRPVGSGESGEVVWPFGDCLPGGVSSPLMSGSLSPCSSSLSSVGCRTGGGLGTAWDGVWRGVASRSSRSKLSPLWAL
ncbi:hypothetical protein AAFF_G00142520 [Aldrovandia affinis]|uniref:Uncharacterized protein n=1 Tax=Aldrovandia affinis TaxID=143900 RepID=A0AAD7T0G2_9TELE|nr:hypothetical protein AAFF_G00142520 [Aldrovandia affinis]